jgi:hypothetical protein
VRQGALHTSAMTLFACRDCDHIASYGGFDLADVAQVEIDLDVDLARGDVECRHNAHRPELVCLHCGHRGAWLI